MEKVTKTILKKEEQKNETNVGVKTNYGKKILTWSKYGYVGLPLENTDVFGRSVGPAGITLQTQKIGNGDPFVRCWTKSSFPFVPFEPIDEILGRDLEKRMCDTFPECKKAGFKIEEIIKKPSNNGNTMHWLVQTNINDVVKNSHVKDDKMKLGFSIRNGYNTGVSLGVDVFTMRLICKNGAFSRGRDLQTQSIRHVGKDPKALLKLLETGLMNTIIQFKDVMDNYNKMAQKKLNEKMAKYIYRKCYIANRFYPDYYDIKTSDVQMIKEKTPRLTITADGKTKTLWENFNDMTYELWRSEKGTEYEKANGEKAQRKPIEFKRIVRKTEKLQDAMTYIVNNPSKFN